jgi:hypothetical protein
MSNIRTLGRAVVVPLFVIASAAACTHEASVPRPLAAARAECARAENGPARRLQPVAVDDAEAALADAEAAYMNEDDDAGLRAIFAQRKAQLAESLAATQMAREKTHDAIAQRTVLLEVRAAEARVIAERNAPAPAPRTTMGAAEMQPAKSTPSQPAPEALPTKKPKAAKKTRAPVSTPQGAPQPASPPPAR